MSGFRWLDILEKEFDKNYVELSLKLRDYEEIYEEEYGSQSLRNLVSCFVQAVHKAQTIFQTNAKLEAQILHSREELLTSQTEIRRLKNEKDFLLAELSKFLKGRTQEENEVEYSSPRTETQNDPERVKILKNENDSLRQTLVELESEVVGARLDARYLDKELAGRIQQIQILLASNATQKHKQKVWSQIESEMHLQRSKTISNMCFSKQKFRDKSKEVSSSLSEEEEPSFMNKRAKQVHLLKNDADELGMAVLGGKEHGVPIMISEIFPDTAVGRCKKISAGDVILAVNGDSFENFEHDEAVKYLSALRGTIRFDLETKVEDDIEEICDTSNRFYQTTDEPPDDYLSTKESTSNGIGSACGSRSSSITSYPGKAADLRKISQRDVKPSRIIHEPQQVFSTPLLTELPEIHATPKKAHK